MGIFNALQTLGSLISTPIKGWIDIKKTEAEGKVAVKKAQTQGAIKRLSEGQHLDASWEIKQIDNSGWKDEFFTILLSIPVMLCFFGDTAAEWVRHGFAVLATTPDWFQYLFGIAVTTSFGIRKLTPFIGKAASAVARTTTKGDSK